MAVTVKPNQANYGGHDNEFVGEVPEKLVCNICTKVLRDPHLTGCCGQHFCESCLTHWFKKHKSKTCPHCREENLAHMQNKALKREIIELKVFCTHRRQGCKWQGELGHLQAHLDSSIGCGYVELKCPNRCTCRTQNQVTSRFSVRPSNTKMLKRKDMEEHLRNECYLRWYRCEHCNYMNTYEAITGKGYSPKFVGWYNHYDVCPMFPLHCPNNCGARKIKKKIMSSHRGQCPLEKLTCPNQCEEVSFVSNFEDDNGDDEPNEIMVVRKIRQISRKNLPEHLKSDCYLRKYSCEHCDHEDTYQAITGKGGPETVFTFHYTTFPNYPLDCPNKCKVKGIKRKDMPSHREQCPLEPVQCPFQEAGCESRLVRRDLEDHMATQVQQHLMLTFQTVLTLRQENAVLRRRSAALETELKWMKSIRKQ